MNWFVVKNDFKRNKTINTTLFLFMTLAYCLAVTAIIVSIQLLSSITQLYDTAKPPHFLQMHKGEINQEAIDNFASGYEGIEDYQTVTMIDVYGDNLEVISDEKSFSLSTCKLDIGLVKQNDTKDLLLNKDKEKVSLKQGEIGIPVLLRDSYHIKLGDHIMLSDNGIEKEFVVTEFVLDAQMNSSMCSSTRILISNKDFNELNGIVGEKEYLIEAYFKDTKLATDYQTAYENAGLPQNGQAVTYTIIFLLSALTDIIMAFILLFASILLVFIAVICIRFTVMSSMEEEIGEIGTMKAIGLSYESIRDIYLIKYRILAVVGGMAGYVMALIISSMFTTHITNTFGNMQVTLLERIIPIAACVCIFLLIEFFCKGILKKMNRVTVIDALVTKDGFQKKKDKVRDGLHKAKIMPANLLIALREVFYHVQSWAILFLVTLLTTSIILIPINLFQTIESPRFISYMGSNLQDILIQLENGEGLKNRYLEVKKIMEENGDIANYSETCRVRVATLDSDNEQKNIYVDCGNTSGEGLEYLNGNEPQSDREIAISYLNSQILNKGIGDRITLIWNGKERIFILSGIYQDVTSGGYTAKSKYSFPEVERELYSFSLNLKNNSNILQQAQALSNLLGDGFTVQPMEEFISQTLGGVINQLKMIVILIMISSVFLSGLVTILFMKLRMTKDYSQIAAMRAIGFSASDIKKQYMLKAGTIAILGIIVGTFIANTIGEGIINVILKISGIGIVKIDFIINTFISYALCPMILIFAVMSMIWICTNPIERYNIITLIKE